MTSFLDGPAANQRLMLKFRPIFMRVVVGHGFDALDSPSDRAKPEEQLCAYELAEQVGSCHIRAGGGRSGFYPISTYRMVKDQPSAELMHDQSKWEDWCHARKNA